MADSKRCEWCRHWKFPQDGYYPEDISPPPWPDYGVCTLAGSKDGQPVIGRAAAFARDSEDYSAELLTLPTFGCERFDKRLGEKSDANE